MLMDFTGSLHKVDNGYPSYRIARMRRRLVYVDRKRCGIEYFLRVIIYMKVISLLVPCIAVSELHTSRPVDA